MSFLFKIILTMFISVVIVWLLFLTWGSIGILRFFFYLCEDCLGWDCFKSVITLHEDYLGRDCTKSVITLNSIDI